MFLNSEYDVASDNTTIKSVIVSAIVAGVITVLVNFLNSNYQNYQDYNSKRAPRLDLIDYTKTEGPTYPFSKKDIFFNVAIRNAHITKMKLKVVGKKHGDPLYKMILFEGGGGGGGMPQCYTAIANVEDATNEYILLDIPNSINKFRKENMPAPVFFNNNLDNFFYKISIHSKEPSFEFSVITELEWKGVYDNSEKNNDRKILKVGPHKYFFLNPIELRSMISSTSKTIYINGFSKIKGKIKSYLNGTKRKYRPKLVFTDKFQDKYILFDNGRMFYLNSKHSHGMFYYFDEKTDYIRTTRT